MEADQLRYFVEHRFFPSQLFQSPGAVIGTITQRKAEFVWKLFDIISRGEECANPYTQDDFQVFLSRTDQELFVIRIEMPEPRKEPECRRIYIVFDDKFSKVFYFTIEMGQDGSHDFLCAWDKDSHANYGKAPEGVEGEVGRITGLVG